MNDNLMDAYGRLFFKLVDAENEIELAPLEARLASENAALNQLRLRARDLQREYDMRCHSLRNGLNQWRQLKARRDGEIKKLRDHDRETKLETFLDTHFISQADIPGITPSLKSALASFGIETAADVDEESVMSVQGFGPKRTAKMLTWRKRVAGKFPYVPNQAIDPQKIQAIHARFGNDRRRLEGDFQIALTDLKEKTNSLGGQIQPAISSANEIAKKTAQTRAYRAAISRFFGALPVAHYVRVNPRRHVAVTPFPCGDDDRRPSSPRRADHGSRRSSIEQSGSEGCVLLGLACATAIR